MKRHAITHRLRPLAALAVALLCAFSVGMLAGCQQPSQTPDGPISGEGAIGTDFEGGRDGGPNSSTGDGTSANSGDNGTSDSPSTDGSPTTKPSIIPPDMADATSIDDDRARAILERALEFSYSSLTFDFEAETESSTSYNLLTNLEMNGQLDTSQGSPNVHTTFTFDFAGSDYRGLEIYVRDNQATVVIQGIPISVNLEGTDYAEAISAVGMLISRDQTIAVLNASTEFALLEDGDETVLFAVVDPAKLATVSLFDLRMLTGASELSAMTVAYTLGSDMRFEDVEVYFESTDGSVGEVSCEYSHYDATQVPNPPAALLSLDASELFNVDIQKLAQEAK